MSSSATSAVANVDDPAEISGDTSVTGVEGGDPITGNLSAVDADGLIDGTTFTSESGDQASNGTASIDQASGAWSYSSNVD